MTARDPKTGRFQKIDIERDVLAPGLGVPETYACPYGTRLGPNARLRVEGDDAARARYGIQGAHVRDAARKSGDPMDASRFLTGAE